MTQPVARYAAVIVLGAGALLGVDLATLSAWPHPWAPFVLAVMLALCIAAVHLQFQVHSGWFTDAGTVPHLATALLLPPGLAILVAGVGLLTLGLTRGRPPLKVVFNTASGMLAVGAAAHLFTAFGGPSLLVQSPGWPAVVVALIASSAYFLVSTTTVAAVVAIDQGRSFRGALGAKLGAKALADIGLGLLGATLALVITTAPLFAPVLVLPGVLLFLANQSMDRAARRSHNLALSSRVGRAVARTLRPEQAFQAILARDVRDTLKLDGLALLPLGDSPAFTEQVACDVDQMELRTALAKCVASDPRALVVCLNGEGPPAWLPPGQRTLSVMAGLSLAASEANARQVSWLPGAAPRSNGCARSTPRRSCCSKPWPTTPLSRSRRSVGGW